MLAVFHKYWRDEEERQIEESSERMIMIIMNL